MDRENIFKEIQELLDKFKGMDINNFQHGYEMMNILNPYFHNRMVSEQQFNNGYGVRSVWMAGGATNIQVVVQPNGYGGKEQRFYAKEMSLTQLRGVKEMVKKLYDDRLAEIARTKANPQLDDLLPKVKELATLWSLAVAPKCVIKLGEGRRQCDGPGDYYALVVKKDGWQKGSIPIRQDKWGMLTYNVQIPLAGSYLNDMELLPEKLEEQLKAAVEEVLGHPVNLDRINRPLKDVVVDKNYRGNWYITCKIDGQQQLRKNLTPSDRDTYLYRKLNTSNEYYIDELKYQMAEKYYATEVEMAQAKTANRTLGR